MPGYYVLLCMDSAAPELPSCLITAFPPHPSPLPLGEREHVRAMILRSTLMDCAAPELPSFLITAFPLTPALSL